MGNGKGGERIVERDIAVLEEMTNQAMSLFANNRVNSAINTSKDTFVSSLASCEHSRQTLKETLRDLLQVEQAESSALDELRAETLGPGASQVVSQIAQAKRRMEEIEEEIKSIVGSISHTEQLEHSLEQRAKSSSKHTTAVIPKIKADVTTFTQISHLKWDYTTPENVVKGFILRPEKRDLTPFKLDTTSHSQFFITNFLWQQIASDSDFI
ncbi:kinetochore protein Spc24-like [Penaeus japonicus]|uniref:kinetochore protein Spc24-like n=1 Tax=Penaeus japonicus TaxID=27405 RepID=UPI001C717825|nr:kinetochore protein Spc24-like [Penaeus japonicus]XP_042889266.1 kinetochore protein Spc24-like [Penaeus japonicus]